ncbi:VCBS repeat-containing protein [Streptomyces sp. NPDC094049]|uniref:VCBS repeat-containing protein n=1 Tax=Streptomyces sp. NPDC094049 TaxID=3154987 RepID=UPI00332E5EED
MHRSTRRRLTAAVTTVLAVTLGAGALAVPAQAVPTAVTAPAAEGPVVPLPYADSDIVSAGVTGFVTRSVGDGGYSVVWSRYSDGTGKAYGGQTVLRSTRAEDFLVSITPYTTTQQSMSTGDVFQVRTGLSASHAGSAADAVFTRTGDEGGAQVLRRHTKADGDVVVTGFPAGATGFQVGPGTPEEALVTFTDGGTVKWGLIDLGAATVGEIRTKPPASTGVAVSASRVAWSEGAGADRAKVVLLDRATGRTSELPLPAGSAYRLRVGLVGDWVVYGEPGALANGAVGTFDAVVAQHPVTKAKVRLLDHLTSLAAAPDGSLYVRGGTVAGGEGLYRVVAAGGATPVVTKVATTGEPTKVVVGGAGIPRVVDLAAQREQVAFRWGLSRNTVSAKLTLRHVRTGKTYQDSESHPHQPELVFSWRGYLNNGPRMEPAPNGDYTWELTVAPLNGIGPATGAKGTFKVARKVQPRDLNDNGTADLLLRDASGRLWRDDTYYTPFAMDGQLQEGEKRALIGPGWNVYDSVEAIGDVAGSAVGDVVAREKSGVLWLHQGKGDGTFAPRVRVGGGWGTYDRITGGSDLTGDGRADLVAADRQGVLWLYAGTGNSRTPFSVRKRIGGGWGTYNDITATGNIAGAPAGDLVARDRAGVLWLYLGKGDGTFAPRARIGAGWNAFTHLVALGDANHDGRPDLMAFGPEGNRLYRGTGNWKAPFKPAEVAGLAYVSDPHQLIG